MKIFLEPPTFIEDWELEDYFTKDEINEMIEGIRKEVDGWVLEEIFKNIDSKIGK